MRWFLMTLLMVTPVLTGCIGGDTTEDLDAASTVTELPAFVPPVPDFDFTDAIEAAHPDHHNPLDHEATYGLELVGHSTFDGFYPPTWQVGFGEVDIHGDLAVVTAMEGELGATLVDISDPADPRPLSYIASTGSEWDARFSDDGKYLFIGCQVSTLVGQRRYVVGDCEGDTAPHAPAGTTESMNQVVAYDVTDPTDPKLMGGVETNGAHNMWAADIDGTYWAFTDGIDVIRFTPDAPEGQRLEVVTEVAGTHDVMVAKHPVTQDWLMYTGSPEDSSVLIYEVNDPARPNVLVEAMGQGIVGWHEQTVSTELIDGRVLLVGGGESFTSTGDAGGEARPAFSIVDITDPLEPELLSQWELPVTTMLPWANYRFSPHNVDISPHGQILMAWYHAGVWVIDASTQERQEDPVTLGFYQPHEALPAHAPPTFFQFDVLVPLVWGGAWDDDGRLVIPDMYTGLYVLEPEWGLYGDVPAAEPDANTEDGARP